MIRLFAIAVCVAIAFASAPAASAVELPATKSQLFAVSDNYAYWVKDRPKGCRGCDQLWRTRLSDGTSSSALSARKGLIIKLMAQGQRIAITEARGTRSGWRSEVRLLEESGSVGSIATGIYHQRKKRACGTIVDAGAFAPAGELAWQRVKIDKPSGNCRFVGRRVIWGAFKTLLDGSVGTLVPSRAVESNGGLWDEELGGHGPILGYDGTRLLLIHGLLGYVSALELGTNKRVVYTPPGEFEEREFDADLGPSGAVVTAFAPEESDSYSDFLFPNAMDTSTSIDISMKDGYTTDKKFCGADLFQVSVDQRSVTVTHRNTAGAIVASRKLRIAQSRVWPALECNSATGVIHYTHFSRSAEPLSERGFSFELP